MGNQALTSMDIAVDMLKRKAYHTFYFFIAQLIFFYLSAFMVLWGAYGVVVAFCGNIVLGLSLIFFITNGIDLFNQLYVGEDEAVSNKFGDEKAGQDNDGLNMFRKNVEVDRLSGDMKRSFNRSDMSRGDMADMQPVHLEYSNIKSKK